MGRVAGIEGEICIADAGARVHCRPDQHPGMPGRQPALLAAQARCRRCAGGAHKKRSTLAEKHQLVTHDTSLVLVKERTDAQRARDMPDICTVQAMLAAGWGGASMGAWARQGLPRALNASPRAAWPATYKGWRALPLPCG